MRLAARGIAVTGQPPPQVLRLAGVEHASLGVAEQVDAGPARKLAKPLRTELLVEETRPHAA